MNWWGSVLWSKQAVYTAFSITAADKPVLSSQFCQKSLINFFPKGCFLKASYWPVSYSNPVLHFLKGSYLKCLESGQKCERQELVLF